MFSIVYRGKPFQVYVSGKDVSYEYKGFFTEKEHKNFLKYLRAEGFVDSNIKYDIKPETER
jgi:hypothetical protein